MPSGAEFSRVQKVQGQGFDSFLVGRGDVAAAGTAVALTTATIVRGGEFVGTDRDDWFQSIVVKAPSSNAGVIFVGPSTVSSLNGFELEPGAAINLPLRDLAAIFVDAAVNGDDFLIFAVL